MPLDRGAGPEGNHGRSVARASSHRERDVVRRLREDDPVGRNRGVVRVVLAVMLADGGGGGIAVAEAAAQLVVKSGGHRGGSAGSFGGNMGPEGNRVNSGKYLASAVSGRGPSGINVLCRHCLTLRKPA